MSRDTGIAWTDSTRNFWSGCTKVGPGCDGCYAEAASRRFYGVNEGSGQAIIWGAGAPRKPHLVGATRELRRWNRAATGRHLVFLNSQSDFFDNEVPASWRDEAWAVIRECTNLTFQIVTKRAGNIIPMLPKNWGDGYPNVWIGITVVNQEEADRDVPKLMQVPAVVRFLSIEPMLGPIDLESVLWPDKGGHRVDVLRGGYWNKAPHIAFGPSAQLGEPKGGFTNHSDIQDRLVNWVIVGGESSQPGHEARAFDIAWARDIVRQCQGARVPVFVKQMGSNVTVPREDAIQFAMLGSWTAHGPGHPMGTARPDDPAGANPDEWPPDLRVREFPGAGLARKAAA